MNPPNSPPSSGRCGMCGSCGSMPPWAPERLKNTSPEARLALERRMEEAQKRFIQQRDAKRAMQATAPEDETSSESDDKPFTNSTSPTENEIQLNDTTQQDNSNSDNEEDVICDTAQNEWNISELPAAQSGEQLPKQLPRHVIRTQRTTEPELEHEDADRIASTNVPPIDCVGDMEDDANVDIPLTPVEIPSRSPESSSFEKNRATPDSEEPQIAQPSRRKQQRFASPVILESPAIANTVEPDMLPEISLGPDQLSEPLRTISLREADSDAESFYTAEGEEGLRRSADSLPTEDEKDSEKDIAPIVSEVEWQAFQDGEKNVEPEVTSKVSESVGSVSAISSTEEEVFLEGFTKDFRTSGQPISEVESLGTKHDDDHEISTATTPSSHPKPVEYAVQDGDRIPVDLAQPNETTLDPRPCEDCERWRERVRELEFKVEALTSALTAREMESASMRARVTDRRHTGKNVAQLTEECESLRMTTEYLVSILPLCLASELFLTEIFVTNPATHPVSQT